MFKDRDLETVSVLLMTWFLRGLAVGGARGGERQGAIIERGGLGAGHRAAVVDAKVAANLRGDRRFVPVHDLGRSPQPCQTLQRSGGIGFGWSSKTSRPSW
jgi:hypothetical protein